MLLTGIVPVLPAATKHTAAAPIKPLKTSKTSGADQAASLRWMKSLTPRERVAQLIVIQFSGHPLNTRSREYRKFMHLVGQEHVGGLILINVANGRVSSKADPLEVAGFLNRMQKLAKVPLIVAGDFERGASMRVDDTNGFSARHGVCGLARSQ